MAKKISSPEATKQIEGIVRYDREDGWHLELQEPGQCAQIQDSLRDFDGKKIKVTFEVVDAKPKGYEA